MSPDTLDPILSEQELAAWLNTSRPTLQRQRSDGSGPEFIQLSQRRIGYRKSAVDRWLVSRTANRASDRSRHGMQDTVCGSSGDAPGLPSPASAAPNAPSGGTTHTAREGSQS